MDDNVETKRPRKKPGAPFFMVAMGFYLLLVHGTSLIASGAGSVQPPPLAYPDVWPWFADLLNTLGGASVLSCALLALPLLYGCMLCTFLLTRQLVGGPPWLGSLAGSFLMAHPAKTEIVFSPTGLYYCLAALAALATTLAYVRHRLHGGGTAYVVLLLLFTCTVAPFTHHAAIFGVFIVLEFMVGDANTRNWLRPLPFLFITMGANWFHLDTLYAALPTPPQMYSPLLLVFYPIGLLPETLSQLNEAPVIAWAWGGLAFALVVAVFIGVKSKPFRLCVIAILIYRVYPGPLPIDFVTMEGGGQLFYPLALFAIGLAAFSAWLMRFETWGQPAVALTTILCLVLFILQFQADRRYVRTRDGGATPPSTTEILQSYLPTTRGQHPWQG